MAWDGNGNFSRTNGVNSGTGTWTADKNASTNILASRHDTHDQDLATGIGSCLTKNNESKPTADFKPNADASYDLGSATAQWKNAYLSGHVIGSGSANLYTPTITNGSNVASSTVREFRWVRIGNIVIVSGYVEIDPTTGSTTTVFDISLPVASAFTTGYELAGWCKEILSPGNAGGFIQANATDDRATAGYACSSSAASSAVLVIFSYTVV